MYIPKHFNVGDHDEAIRFIQANAFGQLISTVDGQPFASHLPFMLNETGTHLLAHVAKQNPQYVGLDQQTVLVTLQGAHDYISPSWYQNGGVPTWNYQAVHIYGRCKVFTDQTRLAETVAGLTAVYEAQFADPWQPDYPAAMLRGIVGLEIEISDIQCKYKLSQNQSAADRLNVATKLEQQGSQQLATAMREQSEG